MRPILFLDTSAPPNQRVQALTDQLLAGQDYCTVRLVESPVAAPGENRPDDQFAGVCESIQDANILVVGVPAGRQQSAMTAFAQRVLASREQFTNCPRKQMVLVLPTANRTDQVVNLWSRVAMHLDMDLTAVVTDRASADQAAEYLQTGRIKRPKIKLVIRLD